MTNKFIKISFQLLLTLCAIQGMAQDALVSSGGDITASNGTVSYSIGQPLFATDEGLGSVSKGVQQAVITVIVGIETAEVEPLIMLYPNPVVTTIHLDMTKEYQDKRLILFLSDAKSELIIKRTVTTSPFDIAVGDLSPGLYHLTLYQQSTLIKSFKIIKY